MQQGKSSAAKAAALVGLFTLGCSGAEPETEPYFAGESSGKPETGLTHADPSTVPEAAPEPPEPGKERQALTTWDGFGSDGFSNRCWTEGQTIAWGGGRCWFPASRKIYFVRRMDSCTGPYAADYQAALDSAFAYVSSELALNGFQALLVLDASSSSNIVATIGCGSPWSGISGSALAGTEKEDTNGCSSNSFPGRVCMINKATVRLFRSRIETPQFARAASSLRRQFLRNVIAHEMGHVAGLGHDLCGPSPLARLMNDSACMSSHAGTGTEFDATDYPTWSHKSFTTFERDMLFNYRP
jgi:hypothetical protein